jgi:hypothetical protein
MKYYSFHQRNKEIKDMERAWSPFISHLTPALSSAGEGGSKEIISNGKYLL